MYFTDYYQYVWFLKYQQNKLFQMLRTSYTILECPFGLCMNIEYQGKCYERFDLYSRFIW
jgi:hypothetical protein